MSEDGTDWVKQQRSWLRHSAVSGKVTDFNPDEATAFYVRFEVFTAVTMKNGVSWDVMPCGSCKKRRFGGT
jgi:hypothetical protein